MEKNEKYTDRMRKKKNEQLNKMMRNSSDEEDIREWAKGVNNSEDESEPEEDELDDIQLSSGEEDEEGSE